MTPEKDLCGSGQCLVDRLEESLTKSYSAGFSSIEKLMNAHHEMVKSEIADIKHAIKDQGDEIFPRLRSVEERITVIEKTGLTENKARELIATNAINEAKVKAIIDADEKIIGWENTRKRTVRLVNTVIGGVILWLFYKIAERLKFM